MGNIKCKYSTTCPVFQGTLKEEDKPSFVSRNIFCNRGFKGWNACKRFHVYELGVDPPKDLLPGNRDSIENILSKQD
jgi:hypothetical protein